MPLAELDDVTIHYREQGEGPPVLGIMGWGLDGRYWASMVPAVTKTHRFITFDNRGTGRSTEGAAGSIDEMALDALKLLDHLGIDSCVIFGVSMGGAIAQRLALDAPERVSALILAATWARATEFQRRQHRIARLIGEHGGPAAIIDGALIRMFTPSFFEMGQDALDLLVRSFTNTPNGPGMATGEAMIGQLTAIEKHDVLDELGNVTCPTLVLGAKMDMMVPYICSVAIADAIPGAELATFETGHGFFVEEMEAVNDRVYRFLSAQLR
ncbi:MAG TPA: alpha/beta fold hydrolase [Actinomycetota bacterium]|nr:alpha/beta fold hydrolase [Actinomycetota bacterium]